MMQTHWLLVAMAAIAMLPATVYAGTVKAGPGELRRAHAWAKARCGDAENAPTAQPPFSFVYGGRPSSELLGTWSRACSAKKLDRHRTERAAVYADPQTGLVVTCRAIQYSEYPTVEWTLKFKNTGKADTPILSNIRPLDLPLVRKGSDEFKLHWNTADNCAQDSYAPHTDAMGPSAEFKAASAGGRPTTGGYPYWNVEFDGGGCIVVLSWAGQWSADFKRDEASGFQLRAGQELTHFKLHPGEEISSPTAMVQFYAGDWIRSQNIWRRWMLAYNTPHIKGVMPGNMLYMASCGWFDGYQSTLEYEKMFIDKWVEEKIGVEYWDMDAGWYPSPQTHNWPETGTWEPDLTRFPGGIKAESDHLHKNGMKLILWCEPERVYGGTWLAKKHPDWVHGGAGGGLLNLGDPTVWKWVVEHFSGLITSQGVDVYRQDFNIDPLGYWRGADSEDRQGITEIRHIEGYYAYWDELLKRHPGLLIDTCASGGRRNNVETLRRSVPILRSDYAMDPIGNQGHTYGLSLWVPINGTGLNNKNPYENRSAMAPIYGIGWDARKPGCDWDLMRRSVKEWRIVARCMLGDYYPLTPYSLDKRNWIAWQFDLPEKGEGVVEAFRRDEAVDESARIHLRGLDPDADYEVENLDGGKKETRTGADLMQNGIPTVIAAKPGSAILHYRKAR